MLTQLVHNLSFCKLTQIGMGWDKLAGTGVATAQKIVQRPTPFLTRHSASWLGGVTPMNNLPHDHVHTGEYTQTGATLLLKEKRKCKGDLERFLTSAQ